MAEGLNDFARLIREAGVVGAGGAGFPSYVKAASKADTVIVNGAECEPLLQKDQELMLRFTREFLEGLALLMRSTGASRTRCAIGNSDRRTCPRPGGKTWGSVARLRRPRVAGLTGDDSSRARGKASPAHPFFWAPFVLYGDWR